MKTAIIGGGKGCKAILEMIIQKRLQLLSLEIMCVVEPRSDAPGAIFGVEHNFKVLPGISEALKIPGIELVIELTGKDSVLEELYRLIPPGVRVMDHVLAEVFWDLDNAMFQLENELRQKTALEAQLKKDRKRLQQIIDSLPDAILVVDRNMRLEQVNARFSKVTGVDPDELRGKACPDPFCRKHKNPELKDKDCPIEEVLRTKKPVQFIQSEEGEKIQAGYYVITANPIFDEKDEITHVVETARQITEEVRLKRETEDSEQRFRQFIQNVHDMITMKDIDGKYLVISPPAAALFSKTQRDFLGKTDFEIFPKHIARNLTEKDKMVIQTGAYQKVEENLKIQGEIRYMDTVRFPLLDYKGDITGVCSIARDVTEQKQLQSAVLHSEKLAAIGKLAAGVAHELNNPLTGILTFAEELKMDADPLDPIVEDFNIIIHEAMRCRQIVRDLLDYARLEKPQRKKRNINTVIERSLSLVQRQAAFHDVFIDLHLGLNLPDVNVDSNQMQQVFLNLIMNAAEAMKNEGTITISSGVIDQGHTVEVSVKDQGHGISPEKLQEIFEPFFSTKGQQGNGLGLSVVQGIVEQHGGKIKVESQAGVGSTFTVVLPAVRIENRSVTNE